MPFYDTYCNVSELLGKTLVDIQGKVGDSELIFICDDESQYIMYHEQDCCESVYLEDIVGDFSDLLFSPLLMAEEVSSDPLPNSPDTLGGECEEWTFYKFATNRGYVSLRWYGTSNRYYSTSVTFRKIQ